MAQPRRRLSTRSAGKRADQDMPRGADRPRPSPVQWRIPKRPVRRDCGQSAAGKRFGVSRAAAFGYA
jgi:hypothetical protein